MTSAVDPSSVNVPRELVEALREAWEDWGTAFSGDAKADADLAAAVRTFVLAVDAAERPDEGESRRCLCDGGSYGIKAHPFIVHPDCPIHSPESIHERMHAPAAPVGEPQPDAIVQAINHHRIAYQDHRYVCVRCGAKRLNLMDFHVARCKGKSAPVPVSDEAEALAELAEIVRVRREVGSDPGLVLIWDRWIAARGEEA